MSDPLPVDCHRDLPAANETDLLCAEQHPIQLDRVREVHGAILSRDKSQRMAEFFALLGDANRLRIVSALALKELCVCDLAAIVGMSESAVSHQLRALKASRVVDIANGDVRFIIVSKTIMC